MEEFNFFIFVSKYLHFTVSPEEAYRLQNKTCKTWNIGFMEYRPKVC